MNNSMTIKGKRTYVLKFLNPGTLDAQEMEKRNSSGLSMLLYRKPGIVYK